MANDSGIDELIRRATDPASSPESISETLGPAFAPFAPADRPGAERALRRFAETLGQTPPGPEIAGTIAIACGALVESGLDPRIALDSILDRLERQVIPDALAYVNACRLAAADAARAQPDPGDSGDGNPPDPIEQHGAQVAAQLPNEAKSFQALELFSLAVIAMLSRSVEARKTARSRPALRTALTDLGGQYGYAGMLWMMMQVLDDELIVVLHPEQRKGYRVRVSGLADNFQLHTLLADALIGRFSSQWLGGPRPSRAVVRAAGDGKAPNDNLVAFGAFNLWNWQGLKADGTLRDPHDGADDWIWNEGVPADIALFEGTRIVLLGPPPIRDPGRRAVGFPRWRAAFVSNRSLRRTKSASGLAALRRRQPDERRADEHGRQRARTLRNLGSDRARAWLRLQLLLSDRGAVGCRCAFGVFHSPVRVHRQVRVAFDGGFTVIPFRPSDTMHDCLACF